MPVEGALFGGNDVSVGANAPLDAPDDVCVLEEGESYDGVLSEVLPWPPEEAVESSCCPSLSFLNMDLRLFILAAADYR